MLQRRIDYLYACIHTYVHTHTHILVGCGGCIASRNWLSICIHTYIHTDIHTYTYAHTRGMWRVCCSEELIIYMHTYIHTYIHTLDVKCVWRRGMDDLCIHTCIHTHTLGGCGRRVAARNWLPICIHAYILTHTHTLGGCGGCVAARNWCSESGRFRRALHGWSCQVSVFVCARGGAGNHNNIYCHSHNNWGPWNSVQRFLVPVYYWKTVRKPETDPQLLWEWQYVCMYVCECLYWWLSECLFKPSTWSRPGAYTTHVYI
jgi:hypothetical protein